MSDQPLTRHVITPGSSEPTLCPRLLEQGDRLDGACPHCQHLLMLHSPTRPCAGCEAIVQAIAAARGQG